METIVSFNSKGAGSRNLLFICFESIKITQSKHVIQARIKSTVLRGQAKLQRYRLEALTTWPKQEGGNTITFSSHFFGIVVAMCDIVQYMDTIYRHLSAKKL